MLALSSAFALRRADARNVSFGESLRREIYITYSFDQTKSPCYTPSPPQKKTKQNKTKQKQTNKKTRCSTAVSLGAYSLYSAVGKLRPNCKAGEPMICLFRL